MIFEHFVMILALVLPPGLVAHHGRKRAYEPFPGHCPELRNGQIAPWIELPYHCISIQGDAEDQEKAARTCLREENGANLLTVASLRKFNLVNTNYLFRDEGKVGGPFWVDAIYKGSGVWKNLIETEELNFEFFPEFDPHRAERKDGLVWHPETGRLRAANWKERHQYICQTYKDEVETCLPDPNCSNRGDCIDGKCFCDYPFFGDFCQYKFCDKECPERQYCNHDTGTCKCIDVFTDSECTECEISTLRQDGTQVCYLTLGLASDQPSAQSQCESMGMKLVDLLTEQDEENFDIVVHTLFQFPNSWVGGALDSASGDYLWAPGIPMKPYLNWFGGNIPPSSDPNDICVKMDSAGTWGNVGCLALKAFVCEIPWSTYTGSKPLQCITGSTDPCYLYIEDPVLNFFEAQDYCLTLNGYLAVIKNSEENDFILSLSTTTTGLWIGLQEKNSVFYWVTGKILPYPITWDFGEPSYTPGVPSCVIYDSGYYSAKNCTEIYPFVCETPVFSA